MITQGTPISPPFRIGQVSATISKVAGLICECYPQARGLIVTGSAARNEETIAASDPITRWLSDLELLVVLDDSANIGIEAKTLDRLSMEATRRLLADGVRVTVELTPAPERYFASIHPHIFGYELRECGRQVFGAEDYLARIPYFHWSEIPSEDAWRLVSNRMVEWLEYLLAPQEGSAAEQFYVLTKQYLDLVTSLSLFSGDYAPSYRTRAGAINAIASWMTESGVPVDPVRFAEAVSMAADFKLDRSCRFGWLWGSSAPGLPAALQQQGLGWLYDFLPDTLASVWNWQAARIAGLPPSVRSVEGQQLGRFYGLRDRLLGWGKLLLLSHGNTRRSAILRMPLLFAAGTPRSLIYECTARLLQSRDRATLRSVRRRLPTLSNRCSGTWEELGRQCVLTWRTFLRRGNA